MTQLQSLEPTPAAADIRIVQCEPAGTYLNIVVAHSNRDVLAEAGTNAAVNEARSRGMGQPCLVDAVGPYPIGPGGTPDELVANPRTPVAEYQMQIRLNASFT